MAKPLRSQLNQIRAWVRQGRTDAWIAHQLEVSTSELREFRRRHELDAEGETDEVDLRDEIEAEIEAATREEELSADEESDDDEDEDSDSDDDGDSGSEREPRGGRGGDADAEGGDRPKRRRRRRRGGRGKRAGAGMQASFDHGDEGYGLWLDPAIADDPVYTEHWAGHRPVEVTVEPDRIVIKRTGDDADADSGDADSDD
jgi:hypothetical protein